MRRRFLGIFLAVALASVGTVLLVLYVQSAKDSALAEVRMVDALVVSKPVPKGTAPTAAHVRLQRIPVKARAQNPVTNLLQIQGLVATTALLPGEQLVRERFAAAAVVARGDIPKGLLEVTVPFGRDRAVGGKVRPGSKVAILVTFEESEAGNGTTPKPPETHVLMHKVLVTAVQTEQPLAKPEQETTAEGQPPAATKAPEGEFLVTVALDAPSIERLVFAQETGSLWLAVEPEDAIESGTKHVTRENVFS